MAPHSAVTAPDRVRHARPASAGFHSIFFVSLLLALCARRCLVLFVALTPPSQATPQEETPPLPGARSPGLLAFPQFAAVIAAAGALISLLSSSSVVWLLREMTRGAAIRPRLGDRGHQEAIVPRSRGVSSLLRRLPSGVPHEHTTLRARSAEAEAHENMEWKPYGSRRAS